MTKKFWRTEKFRTLQIEWQKKLQQSGFADIENENGGVRQRACNSYRTSLHVIIENKRRYYDILGQMHYDESFKDDVEKLVIGRRSMGIKIKDICAELKDIGERNHRNTVMKILRYYEAKWGILKKR